MPDIILAADSIQDFGKFTEKLYSYMAGLDNALQEFKTEDFVGLYHRKCSSCVKKSLEHLEEKCNPVQFF